MDHTRGVWELRQELEFLLEAETRYTDYLSAVSRLQTEPTGGTAAAQRAYVKERVHEIEQNKSSSSNSGGGGGPSEDAQADAELAALRQRVSEANGRRNAAHAKRVSLAEKIREARQIRDELKERENVLEVLHAQALEELQSTKEDSRHSTGQLAKLTEISVINDAFYIWFSGPFGTINNFRLGGGAPVGRPVEWMEINAALGQAVLAISTIAERADFRFRQYSLLPLGSFSKVVKNDDKRLVYNLFMDPTLFSLFPKSKFHPALFGFLCCVKELADHISAHGEFFNLPPPSPLLRTSISRSLTPLHHLTLHANRSSLDCALPPRARRGSAAPHRASHRHSGNA